MISVRQVAQVFSTFTNRRQERDYSHHETSTNNMVVSSRSSRGRPNIRNEHQEHYSSRSNSPVAQNVTTPTASNHDDAPSSRVKRSRLASVSDLDNVQKRRRLGSSTRPSAVCIPLRGRDAPELVSSTGGNITHTAPIPPSLITHDSSISNSPLQSPGYGPQYDQFRRIEEKAQKVVKKSLNKDAAKDDKRKLRSEHGSSRVKTELAQYFPAFDDMLNLEPVDPSR